KQRSAIGGRRVPAVPTFTCLSTDPDTPDTPGCGRSDSGLWPGRKAGQRRGSNNHVVRPSQSWWGGKARCSTPLRAVINRGPRQSGLGSYQVELVALGVGEGGPPD